jgi:hypothetical protein
VGNDDVTSTRLAAMEREHARLDTEWRAISADLATVTGDAALVVVCPRELRDAVEALPTSPTAAPHAAHLIRA